MRNLSLKRRQCLNIGCSRALARMTGHDFVRCNFRENGYTRAPRATRSSAFCGARLENSRGDIGDCTLSALVVERLNSATDRKLVPFGGSRCMPHVDLYEPVMEIVVA